MKKKAKEEVEKAVILEGQASKDIPENFIIESLKTSTKKEELRQTIASDQVPDEVVLEAIKVVFKEDLQQAEFDAKV